MGMYTELNFNSELKQDTPEEVISVLKFMTGESDEKPTVPDHALFKTESQRWWHMLRCDSYYFDSKTHSLIRWDDIYKSYYLNIQCNFKDYENDIALFLDWIRPYLDKYCDELLGYYRYEEDFAPTLIYYNENGGYIFFEPTESMIHNS